MKFVVATMGLVLAAGIALGAPPPGASGDPALASWFRSLTDYRGIGCCSEADCREVQYRIRGAAFEVFIDRKAFGATAPNDWVEVQPQAILPRENPLGVGVACYYGGFVHCFVQGGAS